MPIHRDMSCAVIRCNDVLVSEPMLRYLRKTGKVDKFTKMEKSRFQQVGRQEKSSCRVLTATQQPPYRKHQSERSIRNCAGSSDKDEQRWTMMEFPGRRRQMMTEQGQMFHKRPESQHQKLDQSGAQVNPDTRSTAPEIVKSTGRQDLTIENRQIARRVSCAA